MQAVSASATRRALRVVRPELRSSAAATGSGPRTAALRLRALSSTSRLSTATPTANNGKVQTDVDAKLDRLERVLQELKDERAKGDARLGGSAGGGSGGGGPGNGSATDTALGIALGTALLGCGGIIYFSWYKWNVLRKMEIAFEGGYDPVLELEKAARSPAVYQSTTVEGRGQEESPKEEEQRVLRKEQALIDRIMSGQEKGHYWLLLGPKGSGKTSMLISAILEIDAEGIAVCEAHEDPEVFRLRFGKALNFEFHEDSYNGLFQRRDPKEAGPMLDFERAMSKLEKVAIRFRKKKGRPLVIVFNNVHFLSDDDVGHGVLHLLQQKAESWAASQCATMVFNSDDFRIYDLLKKNANRMEVVSVGDLSEKHGITAIRRARRQLWNENMPFEDAKAIYDLIGGRLSTLMSLAKREDMVQAARHKVEREKQWLLSKVGLIPDHDDDVMDEQKWSSCSWLLLQELGKLSETMADPKVTWNRAREVMTRPDFLNQLDHLNIIQIDPDYNVRPDSKLLLTVIREVINEDDFQERLDSVMDRVNAIESLHRTRELTLKDSPDADGVFKIMLAPQPRKQSSWFSWSSAKNKEQDGDEDKDKEKDTKEEEDD